MQQAIGFIETKGLIMAVEAADIMVKSANVKLVEKSYVGGGLVYISVTGDVGSVKSAVDAAVSAIKRMDESLLISHHVIPRYHEELSNIIKTKSIIEERNQEKKEIDNNSKKNKDEEINIIINEKLKEEGLDETIKYLNSVGVIELRKLAREYKDFGITGRKISNANKKVLINEFKKYFSKSNF